MARLVNEMGTGLNGKGIDKGPRMQVTAVIIPINTIRFVVKKVSFITSSFHEINDICIHFPAPLSKTQFRQGSFTKNSNKE